MEKVSGLFGKHILSAKQFNRELTEVSYLLKFI